MCRTGVVPHVSRTGGARSRAFRRASPALPVARLLPVRQELTACRV